MIGFPCFNIDRRYLLSLRKAFAFYDKITHNTAQARYDHMGKGILDIIYNILASPSKALEEISKKKPLGWAMITAVFIAVVLSFTIVPNPPELVEVIFDMEKGSFNTAPAIFFCVIIFLAALFIEGGIFHLIVVLLGGRGKYLGIVCGLCFAFLPLIFFAPLILLRALLGASGIILYHIGTLLLLLWTLVLSIIAIRNNYHYSLGRAITIYFIPGVILIIIPILVVIVFIGL